MQIESLYSKLSDYRVYLFVCWILNDRKALPEKHILSR
jgi:hypothetical protein